MKLLRAINLFIQTVFAIIGRLLWDSELYADGAVRDMRWRKCLTCPQYRSDLDMCQECFCQMRVKSGLKASTCPLGKW